MITIDRFEHVDFTSNTYMIRTKDHDKNVYLIDAGNSEEVLKSLNPNQKVKAIFLTHSHYDHIYGINEIIDHFPSCIVYCSEYAYEGLCSDKLNLSFYHLNPIVFKGKSVYFIYNSMSIKLYNNYYLKVLGTEGHNKGSLSFIVNEGIFTGDSLIPGNSVVTKLKSGNKIDAKKSIHKIYDLLGSNKNIYPGHGPIYKKSEVDWNFYNL